MMKQNTTYIKSIINKMVVVGVVILVGWGAADMLLSALQQRRREQFKKDWQTYVNSPLGQAARQDIDEAAKQEAIKRMPPITIATPAYRKIYEGSGDES